MALRLFADVLQGSEEWHDLRRGVLTASVIGQLVTPSTLKVASNDRSRAVVASLVAEWVTGWSEDSFTSFDMLRGHEDEVRARDLYSARYAPVTEVGFMIRDDWGFDLGYSPDGLVGDDGMIEVKSRKPKYHLATIVSGEVPSEHMAQLQCGLLVSGRSWCDYLSYCGGMPMWVKRVTPDEDWHAALIEAAQTFEATAAVMASEYAEAVAGLPATERVIYEDLVI